MARIGSQIPTQAIVLRFSESKAQEAVDLYETCGRSAQDWQKLLLTDIMAQNSDGLWVHQKFGYEVPRQNGKGEVLSMREFWGICNGENICHTAHKTSTSHSAFMRLMSILSAAGYVEQGRKKKGHTPPAKSFKATKQYGLEQIFMQDGGSIVFRTRTEAGGIGESFDLLVIDEAQEYTSTQQNALIYTIAASPNPQTIFCGTPPTVQSKGDVFVNLRKRVLSGNAFDTGWAEWSVYSKPEDMMDADLWYETNPSLGTILKERTIRSEDVGNPLDFIIQRLGYWHSYELKSEITEADWLSLKVRKTPAFHGKLYAGVKFGSDGVNVSLSIAVRSDNGIFVETIDCAPQSGGFDWLVRFLTQANVAGVVIDGRGKQEILSESLKASRCKATQTLPTAAEAISAYAAFRQAIDDGTVCHNGQKSVVQAVSNCEKRLIGTNGAFGFRSIKDGVDVSIVESLAFAYWLCANTKEKRKQRIGY